jgi:hypothetical protein
MKTGSRPTALYARTGLFTPPGIHLTASENNSCDLVNAMPYFNRRSPGLEGGPAAWDIYANGVVIIPGICSARKKTSKLIKQKKL